MRESTVKYCVEREIATISTNGNYSKRLRVVSFDDKPAKLDLRSWHNGNDGEKPLRGVTLTNEEAAALRDALTEYLADV